MTTMQVAYGPGFLLSAARHPARIRRARLAARRDSSGVRATGVAARDVVSRRRGIVVPNRAADLAESILHLHGLWKQGTLDRTFELATNPALTWEQAGELFLAALPAPPERADV